MASKTNRHLIEGIESSDGQRNRARNPIRLARSLEASVIAEGIEAESQLIEVTALGVDAVQACLLGRPTVDRTIGLPEAYNQNQKCSATS
ncbi:EAL domain-containing protein [Arthrobacter sp. 2MCAF14]|uniref:EAL domain-containing protein n=1 Tax=Arthrobacter sp. 2MCAF14 TaxID=3232982 RepID=UPI003F8FF066